MLDFYDKYLVAYSDLLIFLPSKIWTLVLLLLGESPVPLQRQGQCRTFGRFGLNLVIRKIAM